MNRFPRSSKNILIKIETYWNVNNTTDVTNNSPCGIKIETYWNVNVKGAAITGKITILK